MEYNLKEILKNFDFDLDAAPYGSGLINRTYYVESSPSYIMQRINTNIFKDPEGLMDNIEKVTSFLREKIIKAGGNPARETLTIIKTIDGKNYYKQDDNYFRMYRFVEDTVSIDQAESPDDMYRAGKGFGKFQALLDDFPASTLTETIVDFHNTKKRLENLKASVLKDVKGRADSVKAEIDFALNRKELSETVVNEMAEGTIPMRVTHNDTKINNILFDKTTREAVCVIDLDTVMPGSALYDFGDALRIGASTAAEDETDLTKVKFDVEKFKGFAKGYIEEFGKFLTKKEVELLAMSARLLTFECGVRFLTDYLDGDVYFKTTKENHNIDRARNQFKLVEEMENLESELNKIVEDIMGGI